MKNLLPIVTGFLAVGLAASAAFCSVTGLSQLFAGAALAVIIIASFLEATKVVLTIVLHNHSRDLSLPIRIYCTVGVVLLVFLTSAGIYGFLSNGYQKTANKLEIHTGEIGVFETKKSFFEKNLSDNQRIIDNKNKRIETLTNLRTRQETRLDSAHNFRNKDRARKDIAESNLEIQKLTNDIDLLNTKNVTITDSINSYTSKILQLNAGSSIAAEVGPLKYIASLTGKPMDSIVNYILLGLIFLFDPMAVILVIVTSRLIQVSKLKNKTEEKQPEEEIVQEQFKQEEQNTENQDYIVENHELNVEEPIEEVKESEIESTPLPLPARLTQEAFKEYLVNKKKKVEEDRETYSEMLRVFFKNGEVVAGGELPSYAEFSSMIGTDKYNQDTIKTFLTLTNYLNISKVNGERKIALKSYDEAREILENYLSLEVN
jgi:hypothetical protein